MLLEVLRSVIAECFDVKFSLDSSKSVCTFLSSVVVGRVNETVLYLAVSDDDLGIFKNDGCIFVFHRVGVKEDGIVFFAHCNSELVHDTAVAAIEIVLGILADECKVCHAQGIDSIEICQDNACKHFQRSGGRKAGSVGNMSPDNHVKPFLQFVSFFR